MSKDLQEIVKRYQLPIVHSLLVFVDGQFSVSLSRLDDQLSRIIVDKTSLQISGAVFSLPANTTIEHPLHLLFIGTKARENKISNEIKIGVASRITMVEEFVGFADVAYANKICTTLTLAKNAKVNFYKVQNEGVLSTHFADLTIHQAATSEINSVHLGVGSTNACENIKVFLEGEQADCELQGLYMPQGKQNLEYHLLVEHKAADCASEELFKGVIADSAHATFDGKVKVHTGAIKSFAKLNNRNLLLSDDARVTAKPGLEIYADDVQCTHGATVGQLDQVALWYLRSRGISEAEARQMLIDGFVQEIVLNLPEFLRPKIKSC